MLLETLLEELLEALLERGIPCQRACTSKGAVGDTCWSENTSEVLAACESTILQYEEL